MEAYANKHSNSKAILISSVYKLLENKINK